ncbi:MAG: UDP-N-acetylmuramyl-tripeptide synthetase [Candidatus Magasanikbacteria bacterium]|nr:UDP-N-acetylmuramyl-tripeptide synthetase [Candidatus Magasanikbacteria bacterium]
MSIKKHIPKSLKRWMHLGLAWYGAVKYRHPSNELLVIGITGTSGKSSTTYFLRQMLEHAGFTVGSLSTIDFYVAGEHTLNDKKMTMLGRFQIQKYLRDMVNKGCDIAIVETTSEGAVQHRHKFINYDIMVLTNLYPEHIESHGSFENYKNAKLSIFDYVSRSKRKKTFGKWKQIKKWGDYIPKISVVNADLSDTEEAFEGTAQEFVQVPFDHKYTFGKKSRDEHLLGSLAQNHFYLFQPRVTEKGLGFKIGQTQFLAPLFGEHNMMNILSAIEICHILGIDCHTTLKDAVSVLKGPAGRIEFIPEAEQFGFRVIVDYAFEPVAMENLYKTVALLSPKRIIHVFGSTGGGRDIERRFTVGKFVGEHADVCIITDEDPYDDDPQVIMHDVATAVKKTGKEDGVNLFCILDRREAIGRAVDLAQAGDIVLVTGKGSEQAIVVKGTLVPWDDRVEVRNALKKKI